MNFLTINNDDFSNIRVLEIDNEPWFVGRDVCEFFGDTNSSRTLSRIVEDDKAVTDIVDALGRTQPTTIVNESGLYSIIFAMQPQKANKDGMSDAYPIEVKHRIEKIKKFKHWVTSEVLPSIRKNGGYIAGQESLSDEELLSKALIVAQNKIRERDALIQKQAEVIEQQRPKTIFADAVSASKQSILIGELAKLICQNGVEIGQKRLFNWLRENGYLMRDGRTNIPKQKYVEMGLFEIKESTIQNPDGSVRITMTPKVTGKGQVYFVNKFVGA